MATIAEQLTSLANTKTAIKQAIIDKGVQVADTDPFSAYPTKIGEISGAPATRFGASLDMWIGDVDANGTLNQTNWTGALNFAGVTEIGENALNHSFCERTNITSIDLSSVTTVGGSGLYYAFDGCSGITGVLDLSSLQSVGYNGLYYAFRNCTGITSVDFSSLQSVDDWSLTNAFRSCTGLTTISFPSLTSVQTHSFYATFNNCTALTEIHFRTDMQATIETLNGYSSKFGATNATVYFDL